LAITPSTVNPCSEGALGFAQHHAFGIGHQPHAGGRGVFQQFGDAFQLPEQRLNVDEVVIGG
jgi:hypothetical protein